MVLDTISGWCTCRLSANALKFEYGGSLLHLFSISYVNMCIRKFFVNNSSLVLLFFEFFKKVYLDKELANFVCGLEPSLIYFCLFHLISHEIFFEVISWELYCKEVG